MKLPSSDSGLRSAKGFAIHANQGVGQSQEARLTSQRDQGMSQGEYLNSRQVSDRPFSNQSGLGLGRSLDRPAGSQAGLGLGLGRSLDRPAGSQAGLGLGPDRPAGTPLQKRSAQGFSLRPARLCQILLLALALKMTLLAAVLLEPFSPASVPAFAAENAAHPDAPGAPAAPGSVSVQLPDTGIIRPSPGVFEGPSIPSASMGTTLPQPRNSSDAQASMHPSGQPSALILPPVGKPQTSGNGTVNSDNDLRRALLVQQEELSRKNMELKNLEKDVDTKLEQMRVLESRLQIMMKDATTTQDSKLRHLVDVLSNMKAKQAAQVLETLDKRIAVKVLATMRGKQAGEILTHVESKKAAGLAESLSRMQMPLE